MQFPPVGKIWRCWGETTDLWADLQRISRVSWASTAVLQVLVKQEKLYRWRSPCRGCFSICGASNDPRDGEKADVGARLLFGRAPVPFAIFPSPIHRMGCFCCTGETFDVGVCGPTRMEGRSPSRMDLSRAHRRGPACLTHILTVVGTI